MSNNKEKLLTDNARRIARNASIVAAATLLSRILGFARDLIVAFVLGAGPLADAFFVAFRLPNLLRRLFGEGSLSMAFVPVFTRLVNKQGKQAGFVLGRSIMCWLLVILVPLVLLAIFLAGPICLLIAPGFADNPELLALTVKLVRICFPYIIFISGVALCMGILNSLNHFLAPALAPCILNLVLIAASLLALALNLQVPTALAWGVVLAGMGQLLLQQPFLQAQNFSWIGRAELLSPPVRQVGKLMLPTVFGAAVYQLNIVLGTVLASFLPLGSISYLYYADRLVQFPLGIFGVAVSTAALPSLAALSGPENRSEFIDALNSALSLILFISLPAGAGLIGLAEPIIELLFGHGAFSGEAVNLTSQALVAYCLGLPAFACMRSLVSAYYALEDSRTPVIVAAGCLILNIVLGYTLMQFWAHIGLALAVSISSWVNLLVLGALLQRKLGRWVKIGYDTTRMLLLSLLLLGGCLLSLSWGSVALIFIPFWAGIYFYLALVLGIKDARLLLHLVETRLRK